MLCTVYPVGVPTNWCHFPWIIAHNFVSVYCIRTKLGTKMRCYTNYLCTKFQGTRITCFNLMATLTPWQKKRKKEKKTKKTKPIFESLYLGNAWRDFVTIWNVRYWRWRASLKQKSSGFVKAAQRYIYVKIPLLFFLLIYSRVWRAGFLGCTTHYRVSWSVLFCMYVGVISIGLAFCIHLVIVTKLIIL